jgi:hypothetical protein
VNLNLNATVDVVSDERFTSMSTVGFTFKFTSTSTVADPHGI